VGIVVDSIWKLWWAVSPGIFSFNIFCFVPLAGHSSDALHKCHQTFSCSSLWHPADKCTCSRLSHHFFYIMLCIHSLLPSPAIPIFSALFLCAIKHLDFLSPIALLSTAFSAIAELEKNGVFQERMCIRL